MGKNNRGFTLIEIMSVILILGILFIIGINAWLKICQSSYAATLESDLNNAYKIASGYYSENPDGELTPQLLKKTGFFNSDDVIITVPDGLAGTLEIVAAHPKLTDKYVVNQDGFISKL